MTPIHGSERLAWGLATIDEQMCAEVDAEVERMHAAGVRTDPTQFRDDGPDPFGIDFVWAGGKPSLRESSTVPTTATSQPSTNSFQPRNYVYAGAVLAASILLVIGLLIGQRLRDDRKDEVAFAVNATAKEDPARGPGTVASVAVTNQTVRKAYLTIVGLSAERRPAVHYREDQKFISIPATGSREVKNLPASFEGCPVVVVLLTATPAGEVVRGLTTDPVPPNEVEQFRDKLKAQLIDSGYTDVGAVIVRISR